MKARILNICLAVLLVAAGYLWGNRSVVHARTESTSTLPPGRISTVPKAWGHVVGGSGDVVIFEDSDGVVRTVNAFGGDQREQLNRQ